MAANQLESCTKIEINIGCFVKSMFSIIKNESTTVQEGLESYSTFYLEISESNLNSFRSADNVDKVTS